VSVPVEEQVRLHSLSAVPLMREELMQAYTGSDIEAHVICLCPWKSRSKSQAMDYPVPERIE
jgi:hypothetical protein